MSSPATVPVIAPDGTTWDIPQAGVSDAVAKGGKIAMDMVGPDKQTYAIPLDNVHAAISNGGMIKPPGMPSAPVPQELQPGPVLQRGSEAFGEKVIGMFSPLGQVGHDVNQAITSGDWSTLQKKYPPWESPDLWSGIKNVAGTLNPGFEIKRDAKGDILWPETIGANAGVGAVMLAPFHEHLATLPEDVQGAIKDAQTARATRAAQAAEAAATAAVNDPASQLTFAQRHPELVTKVAKYGGGAAGATLGSVFGPVGTTVGTMGGAAAGESFAKRFTAIPEEIQDAIDDAVQQAKEQRKAGRAPAPQPQPVPAQPQPGTPAAPTTPAAPEISEDDIARGLYGMSAKQAVDKYPNAQEKIDEIKNGIAAREAAPAAAPAAPRAPAPATPAAPPEAAGAPAATPAEVTLAAPAAVAPEAAPAVPMPLERENYFNRDYLAKKIFGYDDWQAMKDAEGEAEAKRKMDHVYSRADRTRQVFAQTIPETDQTRLSNLGYTQEDIDKMSPVDAEEILGKHLAPEAAPTTATPTAPGLTEQLKGSLEQTPPVAAGAAPTEAPQGAAAQPQGQNLYRPMLRPAGSATLPRGLGWDYVEAPTQAIADRRGLPLSDSPHGVISTDRPLTADEVEHFDLQPVEPKGAAAEAPSVEKAGIPEKQQSVSALVDERIPYTEAPNVNASVKARAQHLADQGKLDEALQLIEENTPEKGGIASIRRALSGQDNTGVTLEERDAALATLKKKMSSEGMGASVFGLDVAAKAIWGSPEIIKLARFEVERLARAGMATFENFATAMGKYGAMARPHIEELWNQESKAWDELKVQPTRKPTGGKTADTALAGNEPIGSPWLTNLSTYDRLDPTVMRDAADAVTGKKIPPEPMRDDIVRGQPRFATDKAFETAHQKWADSMRDPYVGFKPDPATADNPRTVVGQFIDHLKANKRIIWDMIPDHLREAWMQWYDTARQQSIKLAAKTGLTNEQGAGLIATQSPQKDWFQNLSLADRMNDIWDEHKDSNFRTTQKMLDEGNRIANGKVPSATFQQLMKSKILEGKTLADLETPKVLAELRQSKLPALQEIAKSANAAEELQVAWVRLYDHAYNDPWYRMTDSTGEDLGFARNDDGSLSPVQWQGLDAGGKGISILKNGSPENIYRNLGNMHKVPNFNNNVLAPDHPWGYYTSDTHDVAAGLGRPIGGSRIEVKHNFGSGGARSHADTGLEGTYGLHAQSGMDVAKDVGVLPRQFQSVVWEGIRKLFPDTFKTPGNLAKIDDLWRQYETGDLTRQQVWDGIFKVRAEAGLDVEPGRPPEQRGIPKEFLESRKQYETRRAAERQALAGMDAAGSPQSLSGHEPQLGRSNGGGTVDGAEGALAGVGKGTVAPLSKARRAQ